MKTGRHFAVSAIITLCAVFCAVPRHSTLSHSNSDKSSVGQRLSANEALALLTVQHLVKAEHAFQAKFGGTNFGSLKDLAAVMADGIRDGYRFQITTNLGSSAEPSAFRITASPVQYGVTGRLSFYGDETSVLRGNDKLGADASPSDPEFVPIN